jgi:hypothetical protein
MNSIVPRAGGDNRRVSENHQRLKTTLPKVLGVIARE